MKKLLVFLLSLTICFTPTLVFAGAEKWELVENVYDKSKNVANVTAKKITQQAANNAVYKVQVPVNAGTLGSTIKMMLKGGVAVAAITAMVEGVGWIIENGQILKKQDPENVDPSYEYYWQSYDKKFPDPMSAFNYWKSKNTTRGEITPKQLSYTNNGRTANIKYTYFMLPKRPTDIIPDEADQGFNRSENPNYDPSAKPKLIPVSDTEVGNEATGDGKEPRSSPTPYNDIVTDAYSPNNPVSDAPAPKETNNALDSANPEPETEPKGEAETEKEKDKDGNETGKETSKFELPNFCEWAPAVCDFFKVQKQDNKDIKDNQNKDLEQNKTFFESVSDYLDWTKKEPDKDNSDNDLPTKTPEPFDTSIFSKDRFSVSRQCPMPEQHTISLSGISVNFAFDLKPICSVLELARPALIACSYLYACYIVIGAARNG